MSIKFEYSSFIELKISFLSKNFLLSVKMVGDLHHVKEQQVFKFVLSDLILLSDKLNF